MGIFDDKPRNRCHGTKGKVISLMNLHLVIEGLGGGGEEFVGTVSNCKMELIPASYCEALLRICG